MTNIWNGMYVCSLTISLTTAIPLPQGNMLPEQQVRLHERGERTTALLGECSMLLPGCGICCKQQTPEIASVQQLEAQRWGLSSVIGEGGFSTVFLETLRLPSAKPVLCAVKRLEAILHNNSTEYQKRREIRILEELMKRHVSFDCYQIL